MTRIVLVRHGAVDAVGTAYGQRVDPALSDHGRVEVTRLRERIGRDDPAAHPPVVVICHGGPIRCAVAHVLGLDDVSMLRLRVGTATSTWITRWPDGSWTLERLGA